MALDVAMIMRLVDRFTGPAKKMERGLDGITAKARKLQDGGRSLDRLTSSARRGAGVIGGLLYRAAHKGGEGIAFLARKALEGTLALAKWGALGAAGAAAWFGFDIIKIASDFEQFQVVLEGVEGSAEKARASMAWVRQFAQTTPYEVAQVMEAFVRMRAYGIDPMDGSLRSLGNAASAMNKQLIDAVEMMADAQTGEFERLKEFGIKAKVQGDKVAFSYSKNGKDMVRTAGKTSSEIRKALVGIMDDRFEGMMERQSKTLAGLWSNIKDQLSGFQLDIADAGVFDLVKAKAEALFARLSALAKDGTLRKWASDISNSLEDMVNWAWRFVNDTDWRAVASDVATVGGALGKLISLLATAVRWAVKLRDALTDVAAMQLMLLGNPAGYAYFDNKARAAADAENAKKW